MTHTQATRLLDLVRSGKGADLPDDVISEALYMTGDGPLLTELPNPQMEAFIQAMREAGQL
jgi:hypothetical protein